MPTAIYDNACQPYAHAYPSRFAAQTSTREASKRASFLVAKAMGSVDYLSYGFALVVLSGGVMGYMKAGESVNGVQSGGALHLGV